MPPKARPFYPCTVTPTRYSGTYEEGLWASFREYPEKLPEGAFGSDPEAARWWRESGEADWVGVGDTPQSAYDDMVRRWRERGCPICHGLGLVPASDVSWRVCEKCGGKGR